MRTHAAILAASAGLATAASACLSACQRNVVTEFPPGLEPLEDNEAPWPDGDYPETLEFVSGSNDEYDWGHGRAYVRRSIDDVFPALRDIDACVDRRKVDEWTVDHDVEEDYEYSYVIHNVVHDIITVEYDVTWRHGQTGGTEDEITQTGSRFQKTEGSSVIELMEGSIQAIAIEDDVTGLELEEHLASLQSDTSTIESYLRDYYADVLAVVYGEPLPEYDR